MCYTCYVRSQLSRLDELLARIRQAQQRGAWRRPLLDSSGLGLSLADVRVLRAIERRAAAGSPPSISDIADDVGVEHSTASRAVANVESAGLVSKTAADTDQRRSSLVLTARGRRALARTTARRRQMVDHVVSDWTAADLDKLVGLLERLADDFDARTAE